jgi:hypothetical protein
MTTAIAPTIWPIALIASQFMASSNEKEISHGRVSWQTPETFSAMGPLASSIRLDH